MTFLTLSGGFPAMNPVTSADVSAEERMTAIDFVNRNNFLFAEFDIEKIVSTFVSQAAVDHFHGKLRGHDEIRHFLATEYPYLIPGVSRHATNHIVDRDGETGGVVVRYYEQLFRNRWPGESEASTVTESKDHGRARTGTDLPGLWLFCLLIDRLVMTEDGWKIHERHVGEAVFNNKYSPPKQ